MIGTTVLHYKIIEELGRGGMGVVYLAEDAKLGRKVAIKFLPRHIARDSEQRKRLRIEARSTAALNHPNIAHVYAIEESDHQIFIVVEFIDGVELKDKIHPPESPLNKGVTKGWLPVNESINIAAQIAEGLEAAHKKGIVHRDVKSQNIMITDDGKVKIMDFGLAKIKGGTQVTKIGTTVGTAAYMSPEQAKGDEVDQRTDIWALGVILYEMLTGKLPFKGDYEQAVVYAILNEQPQSVESFRSDIPTELIPIVNRSLEKDPNDRYQSISDLLMDLRRLKRDSTNFSRPDMSTAEITQQHQKISQTKNVPPGKQKYRNRLTLIAAFASLIIILIVVKIFFLSDAESTNQERLPIAVADFINQTNEPELDGLSGMLITALEQSRKLAVVTRSRMFDILGQMGKKDLDKIDESLGQQICKQANIEAMVVASIRKFGKLYTIDLKVVDPNKNEYLFTAKEEAEGQESIPSMLDKLSEKTRIGLNERIAQVNESSRNVASVTTNNLESYQHFFQGEQLINQLRIKEAIEEFKKAVAIDSTFAQAYYRLAYAESWEDESEVIQKSHLDHALKHINRMPEREQYLVRATNAIIDNNYKAGIAILKEMEQVYPDDKEMIYNIGDWSYHLDDYTTAVAYLEKTLQIDPNHQRALQHLTWTYRDIGNYDKMLETAKRYVAVSGSGESYQLLSSVYTRLGQLEQGISTLKQARDLLPNNYEITGLIADLYTYLGLFAKAEEELKTLVENNQTPKAKLYGYEELADFYPFQGKYRRALHFADKAIELGWQNEDTTRVLVSHIRKGFLLFFGWNDLDRAWKETEKTFPFNNTITFLPYWGALYTMQIYHGDYDEALSVAKTIPIEWAHLLATSIIYSLERDEKNAEIFADSTFQTCSDFAKISILYLLAECQYEEGLLDKALESLRKLQPINSNFYYWRANYYPKSFYLMGKIYEKKGDTNLAIKNYEKFLELWKDADKDLPDLIDAKTRYAKLTEVDSK